MNNAVDPQMFPEFDAGKVSVPGRVNLIGEHIDYYGLPVLPMAIAQRVTVSFVRRADRQVKAASARYGERRFALDDGVAGAPGDWVNYLKAAAAMLSRKWNLTRGLEADIRSDLPTAAGLSSSSALLTAFALALLRANGVEPSLEELLALLPEGEQYVGTRGGGMDHAAVLASRAGCALLVRFGPGCALDGIAHDGRAGSGQVRQTPLLLGAASGGLCAFEHIPIPPDWTFLVAHSLTTAEKSGAVKAEYNARRAAGLRALELLDLNCFDAALRHPSPEQLAALLPCAEQAAFLHAVTEAKRVERGVEALRRGDAGEFGTILNESHASLRDRLRVSNAALDELVKCAVQEGALGARLTGAGFGGCALALCRGADCERLRRRLTERFYARRPGFDPARHLFVAQPSAGALSV